MLERRTADSLSERKVIDDLSIVPLVTCAWSILAACSVSPLQPRIPPVQLHCWGFFWKWAGNLSHHSVELNPSIPSARFTFPFSFPVPSIVLCQCYRPGAKSKVIVLPQEGEQTLINYNEESRSSFSEVSVTAYIHTTHLQCCVAECATDHLFNYIPSAFGIEQNKAFLLLSLSGELCTAWAG